MKLIARILCIVGVLLLFQTLAISQETMSVNDAEVRDLIVQLYSNSWQGAENNCNPMCWNFHFTKPMQQILDVGAPAQKMLLQYIDDSAIKDQIIILLGGVGDEQAVGPIINAMVAKDDIDVTPNAARINLSAILALTNITVSEVIWHHGGGIEVRRCPNNPKECWAEWWQHNKSTFTVKGITQSRNYSNYPNYGIYRGK